MKISNDALLNKYIDNAKRLHDAYVNDNNKNKISIEAFPLIL